MFSDLVEYYYPLLQYYGADRPCDWDMFNGAVTFACNTRPHTSTKLAPFQLALSNPTQLSVKTRQNLIEGQLDPSLYMRKWRSWLRTLISKVHSEMKSERAV